MSACGILHSYKVVPTQIKQKVYISGINNNKHAITCINHIHVMSTYTFYVYRGPGTHPPGRRQPWRSAAMRRGLDQSLDSDADWCKPSVSANAPSEAWRMERMGYSGVQHSMV